MNRQRGISDEPRNGLYLLSESLPESRHGRRGEVSAGDAAHHHGQPFRTGPVGLGGRSLAQLAAGQMGFVARAVDGVVPVRGPLPAGEHPAQMGMEEEVNKRVFLIYN